MDKDITETSNTIVREQERSLMGERHIRIGNRFFHLVDVPDDVTDATLVRSLKLNMMILEKEKVKKAIEESGIIAS